MEIEKLLKEAVETAKVKTNEITSVALLNQEKSNFLGKKGIIAEVMKNMKDLTIDERKAIGILSNEAKGQIEEIFAGRQAYIEEQVIINKLKSETIDVTLPSYKRNQGSIHPLMQTIEDLEDLYITLGYSVAEGPEVETDENCFEKLNLPKGHPARDMQDTFYIDVEHLLRSHTSPVQIRTMLAETGKPIKIICPGKVYRRDADDATHSHQFMQCEGLVLGADVSLADLKGALLEMVKMMFGEHQKIRLRPSFFPFTEPSVEVDVSCFKCGGAGCPMCKNSGWIEILGAGMVNNNVLEMCGYDSKKIQGFAFGVGVERITMLRYHIEDIRNFYTSDVRFLRQFKEVK